MIEDSANQQADRSGPAYEAWKAGMVGYLTRLVEAEDVAQ